MGEHQVALLTDETGAQIILLCGSFIIGSRREVDAQNGGSCTSREPEGDHEV
jgi:hypothetical protein